MAKTLTFGAMHLVIAFSVTYVLTGSVAISGAITLIEPLVNTVAHYFFDKYWGRYMEGRAPSGRIGQAADPMAASPHPA